jgi:hypothetical protein
MVSLLSAAIAFAPLARPTPVVSYVAPSMLCVDNRDVCATVTGYFEFGELKLLHRDPEALAEFEEKERMRWLAVYDEEWPATQQELYEGDLVEVVRDVSVRGIANARGMQGIVTNVWMECETDAACCCNELATAPITVKLELGREEIER